MDQIEIKPIFVSIMPTILEGKTLYISKLYGVAIHLCLCGCKNKTVTPFKEYDVTGNKYFWQLIDNNGLITLVGSIGNFNLPCKSHYTITNNIATW